MLLRAFDFSLATASSLCYMYIFAIPAYICTVCIGYSIYCSYVLFGFLVIFNQEIEAVKKIPTLGWEYSWEHCELGGRLPLCQVVEKIGENLVWTAGWGRFDFGQKCRCQGRGVCLSKTGSVFLGWAVVEFLYAEIWERM